MKRCGRIHDVIFGYSKTDEFVWKTIYTPYNDAYVSTEYRHEAADGRRYKETDATAAKPGGDTSYEWRIKRRADSPGDRWVPDLENEHESPKPGYEYHCVKPYKCRFWAYSKENMIAFWNQGKLIHRNTGMPRIIQLADEMPGVSLQNLWDDIPPVAGAEALGYPTQKPEALWNGSSWPAATKGMSFSTRSAVAERLSPRRGD